MSGALIGGLLGASFGSALAMLVFAPLTAVNNFLGSYYFGSGMILGEREMYQERWIQIKKELDKGTPFINVLEDVMRESTQGVMSSAERTLTQIKPEWERMVKNYMATIPENIVKALRTDISLEDIIKLWQGGSIEAEASPPPTDTPAGELISYTVGELEQMNLQQLTSIINNADRYTETTVAFAITVKKDKLANESQEQADKEESIDIRNELQRAESEFLKELIIVTENKDINSFYANYITKFSSDQQKLITGHLKASSIYAIFTKRRRSTELNKNLSAMRDALTVKRKQLIAAVSGSGSYQTIQKDINARLIVIAVWQIIYSL